MENVRHMSTWLLGERCYVKVQIWIEKRAEPFSIEKYELFLSRFEYVTWDIILLFTITEHHSEEQATSNEPGFDTVTVISRAKT